MDSGARPSRETCQSAGATRRDTRRRELWRLGEELAGAHFVRLGFDVLERNARTRHGEIDLIAFDGRTLVFAEVKTRQVRSAARTRPDQDPLAGLRPRQRVRLRRLAVAWLAQRRGSAPYAQTIRFDAVGVTLDSAGALVRLEHLEAAW
jgi:putative endonuclease